MIVHFQEYAKSKEIFLLEVNIWENHCHALISLGRKQNIADLMRLIKGESAYWPNKSSRLPYKFSWQDDYYAVSVSESHLSAVCKYSQSREPS